MWMDVVGDPLLLLLWRCRIRAHGCTSVGQNYLCCISIPMAIVSQLMATRVGFLNNPPLALYLYVLVCHGLCLYNDIDK